MKAFISGKVKYLWLCILNNGLLCGPSYFLLCSFVYSLNKQQTKKTNKQINILEPIYLSQIKSDPHEIFRVYSCGCTKMIKIKKTNSSTNKQTNKQTNKHFLKSYISQPNQVQSSRNFQGIFLWVFQDD